MSTTQQRRALGEYGERLAARYLVREGMVVLDRNWRCAAGELDLVMVEGRTVVFCEVKTRSSTDYGSPIEAVTPAKGERLRRLADRWLEAHAIRPGDVRIDVVGVLQDGHGAAEIDHVRGVA